MSGAPQARIWSALRSRKRVFLSCSVTTALKFGPASAALAASGDLVARAAKAERVIGKSGSVLELIVPQGLKVSRLLVVGDGKAGDLEPKDFLKLGGIAMGKLPANAGDATIFAELAGGAMSAARSADLAQGVRLRAYAFDRYKTKRKEGGTSRHRQK